METKTNLMSSKEPANLITIKEAKDQLEKFQKAHPGYEGNEYALHTWISIADLENYIEYIKQESKGKNIEVNGIEFIFTQYKAGAPNLPNLGNNDYELTFMYAPTCKEGTKNVAFDPLRSKDGEPAKLSDLLGSNPQTTEAGKGPDDESKSGIANRVNCCPNMCY